MILIDKNLSELSQTIAQLILNTGIYYLEGTEKGYPDEYKTYDEAWQELILSFDNLKDKLGHDRYEQVVDMTNQAKQHYESNERQLGSWLMQDIRCVVKGISPGAYPENMYRWPKVRLVK